MALLIAGIDAILAPTVTPWLVRTFGNVRGILAGMVLGVIAYATFVRVGEDWSYGMMLPGLVLIGLAFSLAYGPLTIAATDGVDEAGQGLAGGLLNASVQFGGALMLAVVTAVNVIVTDDDPTGRRASTATGLRSSCHWSGWRSARPSRPRASVDLRRLRSRPQRPPWRRSAPTPRRPDASPAVSLPTRHGHSPHPRPPRDKRGNGGNR